MRNRELVRQNDRLDWLFDRVADAAGDDPELKSHWARYLCVVVCGFIENGVEEILLEYTNKHSDTNVTNFVSRDLKLFQNPKVGKIAELLGSFSRTWQIEIEMNFSDELKAAVDSVVTSRHGIAHGGSTGITFVTIQDYYKRVVEFIDRLESLVNP